MASAVTNCIYRPRAPQPSMNLTPPAVATSCIPAPQGVRKDCGFPWWIILLLLGLIVIVIVWAWLRSMGRDPIPLVIPAPPTNSTTNTTNTNGNSQTTTTVTPVYFNRNGNANGNANVNGNIRQGKSQTIRDYVSTGTPALFMFSVNGCRYCDLTKPELEKASKFLNIDIYEINRINLERQDYPKGYPFIFALTPDGSRIPFMGKRCAKNIIEFVRSHIGDKAVNMNYTQLEDCNNY